MLPPIPHPTSPHPSTGGGDTRGSLLVSVAVLAHTDRSKADTDVVMFGFRLRGSCCSANVFLYKFAAAVAEFRREQKNKSRVRLFIYCFSFSFTAGFTDCRAETSQISDN